MDTPNYNPSAIAGNSHQRACVVRIENPYGAVPSLTFCEEKIYVLDGSTISQPAGVLTVAFDPTVQKHLDVYNMLNDLYVEARTIRDAGVV